MVPSDPNSITEHPSERVQLARQVSHSLRSPLATLKVLDSGHIPLSEEARLLVRGVTEKVQLILRQLEDAQKNRTSLSVDPTSNSRVPDSVTSVAPASLKELKIPRQGLLTVLTANPPGASISQLKDALIRQAPSLQWKQFTSPGEFTDFITSGEYRTRSGLVLVQHDLNGYPITGLQLILSLNLSGQSILLIRASEDPQLLAACAQNGISVLSEDQITSVPMV